MPVVPPVGEGVDDWCAITTEPLEAAGAIAWATLERCGAVVTFSGTVRDHSEGRDGVVGLEYDCYEEYARHELEATAAGVRGRWPTVGRIALLHRYGRLTLGETSVLVVVSAPHRDEAFAAARSAIDTVKTTVPIWKKEHWRDGAAWVTGAAPRVDDKRAPT